MSAQSVLSVPGPLDGLAFGLGALATLVLAGLCARAGLGDRGEGETSRRKLQSRPVPPVGGAALLVTYLLGGGLPALEAARPGATLALFGVFAVGTWDDWVRGGLRPATKFVLQAVALLPLLIAADGGLAAWGFFGACLAALNVVNTFDNADGAVGTLAAAGLALASPFALGAVLGFLPFNLDGGRSPGARGERPELPVARRTPTAYLGDAGAFVVALLLMLHPAAWPALWIPAVDLVRLSWVRTRAGSRPWIGDRRHLAHRLQGRLGSAWAVVLVLALLALPGMVGAQLAESVPDALPWGLALGGLLYLGALALARPGAAEPMPARAP